jgi:hypothetical protein
LSAVGIDSKLMDDVGSDWKMVDAFSMRYCTIWVF